MTGSRRERGGGERRPNTQMVSTASTYEEMQKDDKYCETVNTYTNTTHVGAECLNTHRIKIKASLKMF